MAVARSSESTPSAGVTGRSHRPVTATRRPSTQSTPRRCSHGEGSSPETRPRRSRSPWPRPRRSRSSRPRPRRSRSPRSRPRAVRVARAPAGRAAQALDADRNWEEATCGWLPPIFQPRSSRTCAWKSLDRPRGRCNDPAGSEDNGGTARDRGRRKRSRCALVQCSRSTGRRAGCSVTACLGGKRSWRWRPCFWRPSPCGRR